MLRIAADAVAHPMETVRLDERVALLGCKSRGPANGEAENARIG
jgi:hypothetical protein